MVSIPKKKSIKEGLGGLLGNRYDAINSYKNSEHKWKKELKALQKPNKIIFRITKNYGSHCELNMIKKIKAKDFKKCSYYSSDSLSSDSDSDTSLYSDSE